MMYLENLINCICILHKELHPFYSCFIVRYFLKQHLILITVQICEDPGR